MTNPSNAVRLLHTSASSLRGNERQYLLDCIDRNHLSQGRYVRQFEHGLSSLLGARYVLSCSSGTTALHLALLAHGVGPQDTVVVPAMTYIATANAARYCGARVVFCDVDPVTWTLDPRKLRELLGALCPPGRFVILPVHLFAALAPVDEIAEMLAETRTSDNYTIIEDAAHVPGAKLSGKGSIATYSFYGSKIIACGEGGAVATDDEELASKVHLFRGQGVVAAGRYDHSVVGYNYRLTDLQAAVGCAQVERYTNMVAKRRRLATLYRQLLSPLVQIQRSYIGVEWAMPVLLPSRVDRDLIAGQLLHSYDIETRPFFTPLCDLPPYIDSIHTTVDVSRMLAQRGIILPLHPELTEDDVRYVCQSLIDLLVQKG